MVKNYLCLKHGDIIVNRSNNSVFLLQKFIEIGKSLVSSAPREFSKISSKCYIQYFEVIMRVLALSYLYNYFSNWFLFFLQ